MVNRRRFIQQGATAALGAGAATLLNVRLIGAQTPEEAFEAHAPYDEAMLLSLAHRALESAKTSGAHFADVRLAFGRQLLFNIYKGEVRWTQLHMEATIGVRALTGGAWGFASGSTLLPDQVANVGRVAAARAKAQELWPGPKLELVPAPAVKGRWQTPIKRDPFTVTVPEQESLLLDAIKEADKVKGVREHDARLIWMRCDRIFVSSEGSETVQRIYKAYPTISSTASPKGITDFYFYRDGTHGRYGGYGYEVLDGIDLKESWRQSAEEVVRAVSYPVKPGPIGKHDVVIGAELASTITFVTIGQALELDRALGDRINSVGSSYAAPVLDVIGKDRLGSPLVNVTADRSREHGIVTIGWDEEGVKPQVTRLVQEGVIMDYVTTRDTANILAPAYKARSQDVRSNGCAVNSGRYQPILQCPNLTLEPGKTDASVEDLLTEMKNGYYVVASEAAADQQCVTAQTGGAFGYLAYEVRGGKITAIVRDVALVFKTRDFWKSITAIGGKASSKPWIAGPGNETVSSDGWTSLWGVPVLARKVGITNSGAVEAPIPSDMG